MERRAAIPSGRAKPNIKQPFHGHILRLHGLLEQDVGTTGVGACV